MILAQDFNVTEPITIGCGFVEALIKLNKKNPVKNLIISDKTGLAIFDGFSLLGRNVPTPHIYLFTSLMEFANSQLKEIELNYIPDEFISALSKVEIISKKEDGGARFSIVNNILTIFSSSGVGNSEETMPLTKHPDITVRFDPNKIINLLKYGVSSMIFTGKCIIINMKNGMFILAACTIQ